MTPPTAGESPFGWIAAPHTPFHPSGDLALNAVESQARFLENAGLNGVFIAGSTGEGQSLTEDERKRLAERWAEVRGGLELYVHVGHDSVRTAADLARHAASLDVDAIAAAPPSWFPITAAEELTAACVDIAAAAPAVPFFYYHIPALSGVTLAMSAWLEHARPHLPTLGGIKYTHLDALDFQTLRREHEDLRLLWGHDELLLAGYTLGADAAVGSTYNFAAKTGIAIVEALRSGRIEDARQHQSTLTELVRTLARFGYMAAAKTLMGWLGVDCGPPRAPHRALDPDRVRALRSDLEQLGWFAT